MHLPVLDLNMVVRYEELKCLATDKCMWRTLNSTGTISTLHVVSGWMILRSIRYGHFYINKTRDGTAEVYIERAPYPYMPLYSHVFTDTPLWYL